MANSLFIPKIINRRSTEANRASDKIDKRHVGA